MEAAITSAIGDATDTITAIGTAAMAVVIAFLVWRKVKQGANKV